MPSIPDGEILHVEVAMKGVSSAVGGGEKKIVNVFHFRRTNNVLLLNKFDVSSAFQAAIGDIILPLLNVRYTQTSNDVRWIDDAMDAPLIDSQAGLGTSAGESNADYVTAVTQLKTSFRGRSYRGSKHYAPISEADVAGDVLDASGIALLAGVVAAHQGGFIDAQGNQWLPFLLSRKLSTLRTNPTNVIGAEIVTIIPNKTTGTMRRRKVKTVT